MYIFIDEKSKLLDFLTNHRRAKSVWIENIHKKEECISSYIVLFYGKTGKN